MFKIQGRDVQEYLTDISFKLVRTYKGEIERTQTGVVSAFPNSFITAGLDLVFTAPREVADSIEQTLLSNDTVELIVDYNTVNIKGAFSCTTNSNVELRDKGERHKQLSVSVVSDGTDITKSDGSDFSVKVGDSTVVSNCKFGKVYDVPSAYRAYKRDGMIVGDKLLVLGDVTLSNS